MPIYWHYYEVPELAGLTRKQQHRIWFRACEAAGREWKCRVTGILVLVLIAIEIRLTALLPNDPNSHEPVAIRFLVTFDILLPLFTWICVWFVFFVKRSRFHCKRFREIEEKEGLPDLPMPPLRAWAIHRITRSIPELAGLSKQEQIRLWCLNEPKRYRHWQSWIVLLSIPLFIVAGFALSLAIAVAIVGFQTACEEAQWGFLTACVGAFVGAVSWCFLSVKVAVKIVRPYLREARVQLNKPEFNSL